MTHPGRRRAATIPTNERTAAELGAGTTVDRKSDRKWFAPSLLPAVNPTNAIELPSRPRTTVHKTLTIQRRMDTIEFLDWCGALEIKDPVKLIRSVRKRRQTSLSWCVKLGKVFSANPPFVWFV